MYLTPVRTPRFAARPGIEKEVPMKMAGSLIACLALVVALLPHPLRAAAEGEMEERSRLSLPRKRKT